MTTKVTNVYNLKLTPSQFGQSSLVVNCSQYDSLYRVIQFNLFNGNAVYSIPEGSVVTIRGTKKDNTGFEYECEYSNNVVTFPLQQQITIFPGKVPAELRITNNGEIIGSWNFLFLVEESPLSDETTISETQLPLLEQAIEAAGRLNEAFDDITEFTDETYPNAVQAIQSEGATQVANVTNEGTTQRGLVTSEGATQVGNVQAKGTEVLDSIPSDYTTLANDVAEIESVLTVKESKNLYNQNAIVDGMWIMPSGEVESHPDYGGYITEPIAVKSGRTLYVSMISGNGRAPATFTRCRTLASNGLTVKRVISSASTVTVASDEKYVQFLFVNAQKNVQLQIEYDGITAYEPYEDGYEKVATKKNVQDTNIASVNMFASIGAIGDSYTAGSVRNSAGTWTDYRNLSWIATMGKRSGTEWKNYGHGGATTKTYLETTEFANALSDTACGLYFFALGQNDGNQSLTIGTVADINDADYTQNADTFFGNYGRIIQQIKNHAPNAKLVMITNWVQGSTWTAYDVAIREIASHYSIPVIEPFDDYFFNSELYQNYKEYGHPTTMGYSSMGIAMERLFSECVVNNPSYFKFSTVG
jgi:hypothetical protein